MRYKFPLRKTLQVMGEGTITVDRFGNETMKPGVFEDVQVFGWEIKPVQEIQGDSILRTIDTLEVFMAPEDAPPPDRSVKLPDGGVWQVEGTPADNRNNPYFDAGLVVVRCKKVSG